VSAAFEIGQRRDASRQRQQGWRPNPISRLPSPPLRPAWPTKADLVEITALGRQIGEMRDELRVTSAMVLRLDHRWPDVIEQLRAMVQQQLGILDRLRALEPPV
jgi:hypothetical protein